MDDWSRIPKQQGGSSSSRAKATIPAPGTVVMANVDEDLGDGMYSLRWGNNRIAVSSRSPLKTGQSLILKSELNAEGKPTLVVQGTALPAPGSVSGKVIYGPAKKHILPQNSQTTDSRGGQADAAESRDSRNSQTIGGHVAAGTTKITAGQIPTPVHPVRDLVGLVLEPMPEFDESVKMLEDAAAREKERVKEEVKTHLKNETRSDALQDGEGETEEKASVADRRDQSSPTRQGKPAPQALSPDQAAQTRPAAQPAQTAAQTVPQAAAPSAGQGAAQSAPSAPQPQTPIPPPAAGPAGPDIPAVKPASPHEAAQVTARPDVSALSRPEAGNRQTPDPPLRDGGPAVPDAAAKPAFPSTPPSSQPADRQGATLPPAPQAAAAPTPAGGTFQAATVAHPSTAEAQSAAAANTSAPSVTPTPSAPEAVSQTPLSREAQPQSQPAAPVLPDNAGPVVPEAPPAQQGGQPSAPPSVAQILPETSVAPPSPTPPPASAGEAPAPVSPQPQPSVTGQTPPQPTAPVLPGDGGPVIPEAAPAQQGGQPSIVQTIPEPSVAPPSSAPRPAPVDDVQVSVSPQPQPPATGQTPPQPAAPILPGNAGPVIPEAAPAQPGVPPPASPSAAQAIPEASVAPPSSTPPPAPAGETPTPVPPQPQPSSAGQTPSRPATPVLPGNAGPVIPETQPAQPSVPPSVVQTIPETSATPPSPAPQPQSGATPLPADTIPASPSPNAAETSQPKRTEPTRGTGIYGPPRSDTEAIRQRQASLPAAANAVPDESPDAARAQAKPEAFLKEALTQMVKAAELPLGGDEETPALALAGKPPQAVMDKAADLFLRAAGVLPDAETMAAARALVRHNVHVDKEAVEALISLAADAPEAEREAVMNAAARLVSKDIPVSPPLVAGLTEVLDRRAGAHALMQQVVDALSFESDVPEAQPLMDGARDVLDMLHVDLGSSDAAAALERYLSTFGREAMGRALAMVETSAQAVLEGNPELQTLDQAITAVLSELTDAMAAAQQELLELEGAQINPGLSLDQVPPPAPAQPSPLPTARPMPASINAYLNAPKAFNVAEALKNLPPMPTLVSINTPVPQETPGTAAAPQPGAQPQQAEAKVPPPPMPPAPETLPAREESVLERGRSTLFQLPGLNRQEMELLRPSGFMERFLQSSAADQPDAERIRQEARALMRQLTSENPELAEKASKDLKNRSPEVLKETAARLSEREAETIRANTTLNRLSDAANGLRDLGRQLLAVKAENLAGKDREPGVMLAEVPFKLNDDAGDGRMQMFYRRSRKKDDGWSSRVILDLNTTRMGPVLGDMRFFGQDMILNVFVERRDTAEYLTESGEELVSSLSDKGFRVKARFMVLPPRKAPEIRAERPQIAGEDASAALPGGEHKLDVKG